MPPRRFADLPYGRLAYREGGAGVPTLLLHGIGGNSDAWESQWSAFCGRLHVLAWDAPGAGESEAPAAEWPFVGDYADIATGLLDALGIESANVVGHSLGGLIACHLASAYPARVRRLVLADCSAGHGSLPAAEREQRLADRLAPLSTLDGDAMARRSLARLLSPGAPEEARERAFTVLRQIRPVGYARAARMLSRADAHPCLPAIRAPTLVLCGALDVVTPPESNRRIARAIPDAEYLELPRSGHLAYLEQPAAFQEAILSFLAG